MKPAGAVLYPVQGVTLHRVAAGQRSQGDGEEQTPVPSSQTQESTKTLLPSSVKPQNPSRKTSREVIDTDGDIHKNKLENTAQLGKESTTHNVKQTSNKLLPEIADIAHKLTKVSIMSSPDSYLLNAPPKDLHTKKIIRLTPKTKNSSLFLSAREKTSSVSLYSQKRKDPKFVPYEPYKGCVRPILKKKSKIGSKQRNDETEKTETIEEDTSNKTCEDKQTAGAVSDHKNAEKLSILVKDFEKERATWEKNTTKLKSENKSLEDQLSQIKKEKSNLESQLSVQSQVNTELKKLLVASVGEDVQGRVQCLTEDKARMATMIRHYSEKVDRDYEEKERMGIQCDVWRSKFLGSSMMVDELVGCKVSLMQRMMEAEEALRVVIEEHDLVRQHVLNMYRMNKQLRDAFDPLAAQLGGVPPLASADLVTLAVDGDVLAETVRDRLLGDLGRSVGCSLSLEGLETQTPGEKMARQLIGRMCAKEEPICAECSTVSPGRSAMMHRFHPNARFEHVTVNCCSHCNGEIKVV
ncbi:golgin-45-like isoform X2 [Homarus americanus]|uniref:golgin-45-like isoform X2 n=1 Tax=Homarus americanus TaxID=6706 RepID=UPI001C452BFA|nr:golgin-45-like isoform X2 [Homarus americanus]